ncbi:hypothetical protein ACVW1C_004315 [Bradyrhizobium sp. USDA 4011]
MSGSLPLAGEGWGAGFSPLGMLVILERKRGPSPRGKSEASAAELDVFQQ